VAGTWESTTSNDATATNLMNVINTSSGPAGTRFTATVDGAVVTVTQATTGLAGNTTVTVTDADVVGMTKTNFVSGIDGGGTHSISIVTTDGTVILATSSNLTTTSTDTNTPTFQVVTDNDTTAANLATCLNANGKISATAASAVVTITQLVVGTAGNSTITLTDPATDGMTKVDLTGGLNAATHTIGLIASDGTVVTVAAHRDTTTTTDTNSPTFALDGSVNTTATRLASCLNANSKFSAVSALNIVTMTQLIGGTAGNTSITLTDPDAAGITKTDFTGGTGTALNKANGEFETGTTATETGDNFKALVEDAVHGQDELVVTNTAGAIVVTQTIKGLAGNTLVRNNGWESICDVSPTTYFQNGAEAVRPNLVMQFSHTGNDWGGDLEIISDIEANEPGVKIGLANTTGIVAPYARLVINQTNTTINLIGQCETFYVYR